MEEVNPSPTPKAKLAVYMGNLVNDTRVTNLLLLALALIGMGGAEMLQDQVCSL